MNRPVARGATGFTLIEVSVVIMVLGLLAGLVAANVMRHMSTARDATTRSQIALIGTALDAYRLDNGDYPTTEQGLTALVAPPALAPVPINWRGPYLQKIVLPVDPWSRPYVYRYPGVHRPWSYDLSSLGRDGREGGQDDDADITSWD
jgi:general secretion pathway protein G